ncbi:MAG: DVU_1553 family AMP-dependent CoA ligase, partial [Anaerolineaceae bacterium]
MEFQITPLDSWVNQKIANPAQLTRKALEEYQLERLRETLDLVRKKSPFYLKHLSAAPNSIASLSDLAQFPFTTPQDLREHGLQFLCVSQDEIQRVVTLDTTGTTGQPKRLYFTQEDQELTLDFFHVGMTTFTAPGDKVLILLPCERTGSVGDLLATALQRLGAHPIKHGIVRDVSHTLEVIRAEKIDSLVGIPIQTLELARRSRETRLKSVLLSTDYVPNALARAVERAWGCVVYNHYGMTEMGLGGGVECQARRGYHLREADMLFEIVHPQTGIPVADGETGEVVFTTLTRNGMPLIRYRTGDFSRFIPGKCPCGTNLKTLERIRTRITGMVPLGTGGQLSIADLDEALFSIEGVYDYQATV